jgi:hypothetical protein
MADAKISELNALTSIDTDDVLPVVDTSAGETKKITQIGLLNGMSITNDGTKTTLLGTAGNYNRIGDAGVTSQSLASEDDLLITGKLETNGPVYFDNVFQSATPSASETWIFLNSGGGKSGFSYYADDGFHIFLDKESGTTNRNLIITDYLNRNDDHDHDTLSADPTLFIHSATDPDSNNTQWLSLTHDKTDGVISTGTGSVNFVTTGLKINGTAGYTGTISAASTAIVEDGIITGWS